MRILVDYRPALRHRTGVGEYVHQTARALVASAPSGESLTLFSSSWKDRLTADALPGAAVIDRRVPVRLLNLAWHRAGWPSVETLTGQSFDVVQSSHPLLMPTRQARLVTIYDLDFLDHPERTTGEIRRDYSDLAGLHARRADQVIVISQHTADAVADRLAVPRERLTVCMPGAPDWTPRAAEPATDGCVLFFGSIGPRKNLEVLLDAYEALLTNGAALPRLVLAGAFGPASAAIQERAVRPTLAGHVVMPGYVDEATRQQLFRSALAFVYPSHTEGFGMPVLEAMVSGVPVIAASSGAIPEAAGGAAVLVAPDDVRGWQAALTAVLGSVERRRAMTEAGFAQARRFTWAATAAGVRHAWASALTHAEARR